MKISNIFIFHLTILARIIKYIKVLLDEMLFREIFKVVGKKKFEICLGQKKDNLKL